MVNGVTTMQVKPHTLATGGIIALLVITSLTIETKAIVGALQEHNGLNGYAWAAISGAFAILAIASSMVASAKKGDYRPHVRRSAKYARAVAFCAMLVPAAFFGSAMKADNMADRRAAYTAPGPNGTASLHELDLAIINDRQGDIMEQREARWNMQQNLQGAVALTPADPEFWAAIFFQLMMVFAAGALRIPAPITKEEMDYLKRSVAAKKAAKTRKANVAKRKAAKQQKPRVIVGGKA
jgi:hypothetical protein